jgi:GLPGLI family protein
MGSFTAGPQYKNIKDKSLLQEQEFFGKQFLINDSLPQLEWVMGSESKQIGQYLCFKATAVKKVDEFDWRSMRRRNRNNDNEKVKDSTETSETAKVQDSTKVGNDPLSEIEVPKEIIVTAWYTPQIPVSQGPGEYHGLPGLILEVSADRTTILCSKIVINPKVKEPIEMPTKGKAVSKKEYNDIMKKKMEEMREMYGGRNRGGRSGGSRRN